MVKYLNDGIYYFNSKKKVNKIYKVIILEKNDKFDIISISILLDCLVDRIKSYTKNEFKLKKGLNYDVTYNASLKEIKGNILITLEVGFIDLEFLDEPEDSKIINLINKIFSEPYMDQDSLALSVENYYKHLLKLRDNPNNMVLFLVNDLIYKDDIKYISYDDKIKYLDGRDIISDIFNKLEDIRNSNNFFMFFAGSEYSLYKCLEYLKNDDFHKFRVFNNVDRIVNFDVEEKNLIKTKKQVSMIITYQSEELGYDDEYVLKILNLIFGGNSYSKLFVNVREKENICYAINSQDRINYGIDVFIGVDIENLEFAKMRIDEEFEEIKKGNIEREFLICKREYISFIKAESKKINLNKLLLDRRVVMQDDKYEISNLITELENIKMEDIVSLANKMNKVKLIEIN